MDLEAVPSTEEEWAGRCREYVEALEEERRKIEVFQRELPLSLHLVTQTIESFRQQIAADVHSARGAVRSELEVEEEMTSEGAPVLEEFIPIKRSSSSDVDGELEAGDRRHDHQHSSNGDHNEVGSNSACNQREHERPEKKPDWLRSVQLWSQHPDPHPLPREEQEGVGEDTDTPPRPIAVEAKKATGAFVPFHSQKRSPPLGAAPKPAPPPSVQAASSTSDTPGGGAGGENGGCTGGGEKDGQTHRKIRRCWSPELHRRFLNALQQLGGSEVATPKRIRDLMKVDALTNDEVKSHLQKFRLHSRRPSPASQGSAASPPPRQVVFVGGIWVPPPEYAAAAAAAARSTAEGIVTGPPSGIYAPIASVPAAPKQPQQQQTKQSQRSPSGPLPGNGGHGRVKQNAADDDATRSNSPATSSSSRTTTTSAGRCR